MKVNCYAVFDTASGVYDGPVPATTDDVAKRNFSDMANNPEHPIGKHPECFVLIKVGTWNDGTGDMENEVNESLLTGLNAIAGNRIDDMFNGEK